MPFLAPGKGRLQRVPEPLRPLVQAVVDPSRRLVACLARAAARLRPARFAATWRWLRGLTAAVRARRRTAALTVAVDVAPLWGHLTGIGWYLHRLLGELAPREDLELRLYGPRIFLHPVDQGPAVELPRGPAIVPVFHEVPDELVVSRDWLLGVLRGIESLFIAADRNRVVFAPNFIPPRKFRRSRGALVATVHDLSFRFYPWTLHDDTHQALGDRLDGTLRQARLVLTDSEAVRGELVAEGLRSPETLRAILLGPGHLDGTLEGALPAGVPARFALHVGTFEPRKNLAMLLEAWDLLHRGREHPLPLVLCGAVGWKNDDLRARLEAGEAAGWLVNLGYVTDGALAALYRRALVVCCPSLYEGFGFPVVEAMAAGAPVAASDIPAHREVAGEAALLLPPGDPVRWAAEVAALAIDSVRRRDLASRGVLRAAQFSWKRTAEETAAAWAEAAAMGGTPYDDET